jgi:hypothetical protein
MGAQGSKPVLSAVAANTNSSQLKNAVQDYLNNTRNLKRLANNTARRTKLITNLANNKNTKIRNHLVKIGLAISNLNKTDVRAANAAVNSTVPTAPVTPAVNAVNNANAAAKNLAKKIEELNTYMNGKSAENYAANTKRNIQVNRNTNSKRGNGINARYKLIFNNAQAIRNKQGAAPSTNANKQALINYMTNINRNARKYVNSGRKTENNRKLNNTQQFTSIFNNANKIRNGKLFILNEPVGGRLIRNNKSAMWNFEKPFPVNTNLYNINVSNGNNPKVIMKQP